MTCCENVAQKDHHQGRHDLSSIVVDTIHGIQLDYKSDVFFTYGRSAIAMSRKLLFERCLNFNFSDFRLTDET